MAIPDWVTISLGIVSPLIAAGGALTSWRIYKSQKKDQKENVRDLQRSLATSLRADVLTARVGMQNIFESCNRIPRVMMVNGAEAILVIKGLTSLRMPTVESFKSQIATFETDLADPLLQALSCLECVRHLAEAFLSEKHDIANLGAAVSGIRTSAPNAISVLQAAEQALSKRMERVEGAPD